MSESININGGNNFLSVEITFNDQHGACCEEYEQYFHRRRLGGIADNFFGTTIAHNIYPSEQGNDCVFICFMYGGIPMIAKICLHKPDGTRIPVIINPETFTNDMALFVNLGLVDFIRNQYISLISNHITCGEYATYFIEVKSGSLFTDKIAYRRWL